MDRACAAQRPGGAAVVHRASSVAGLCLDLSAILSVAQAPSGRLAALREGETIEVIPDALAGPTVTLAADGKTIARASLRQEGDRLIARIISLGDELARPADQWRFHPKA